MTKLAPERTSSSGILADLFDKALGDLTNSKEEVAQQFADESNIHIETWEDWVRLVAGFRELADWHCEVWRWAWAIRLGRPAQPLIAIAPRGGGKSSTSEQVISALGARNSRKYILYVRATQAQANASVANIANILESSMIRNYYPGMGERMMGRFGQAKSWNRTMLRTASGFTVAAFGLDSAMRGAKVDDYRPDLICHAIDTFIYDPDLGAWMKVQDHPGVIGLRREKGVQVEINGSPHPEIVTREHRYWVRHDPNKAVKYRPKDFHAEPRWVEAADLRPRAHFIGLPIAEGVEDPPPVIAHEVQPGDDPFGVTLVRKTVEKYLPYFFEPDWWEFFGLWWLHGTTQTTYVVAHAGADYQSIVAVRFRSLKDPALEKTKALLARWKITFEVIKDRGQRASWLLTFRHNDLARWLQSWEHGEGRTPPAWVERADPIYQRALIIGIHNGRGNAAKSFDIVSTDLAAMFAVRRILARLMIPSVVFENKKDPNKRTNRSTQWRVYARDNVRNVLGLDVNESNAPYKDVFIANGCLWSRVKEARALETENVFVPLETASHTYHTAFGLSHNCLDDCDEKHDSPNTTERKIETITTTILPAGSSDLTVLAVQNMMIQDGIFDRLASGKADFLADRILTGPHPAIRDLTYVMQDGLIRITGGTPTWSGQSIEVCERQIRLWGLRAFLMEAQHILDLPEGGMYEEIVWQNCTYADLPEFSHVVCWVDPAVTSNKSSHHQAIQIDALEKPVKSPDGFGQSTARKLDRNRIYRLFSWEEQSSPVDTLRMAIRKAVEFGASKVGVETNQGGDLWQETYTNVAQELFDDEEIDYIPKFDSVSATGSTGSKEERSSRMLADYQMGLFVHLLGTHDVLESALGRFPITMPDDLADAAYWSWNDLRKLERRGRPGGRSAKVSRQVLFKGTNRPVGSRRRLGFR